LSGANQTTTTLREAAEWPYDLGLHVLCRLKAGFDAYATLRNVTNHKYANVYEGNLYPAETLSAVLGLCHSR
jgi:hypothetical protein